MSAGAAFPNLPRQELLARLAGGLAAGITVVTPNSRLAQALAREFDASCIARGLKSWETADILPFTACVARLHEDALYSDLAPRLPLLLSPAQEQSLWEEAIRSSKLADTLLSAAAAAAQCREAWQLAHAWRLMEKLKGASVNEDATAFLDWAARYERATERYRQIDAARLPDLVATLLPEAALRKPGALVLYGFDIVTAQQRLLADALALVGVEVFVSGQGTREAKASRIAFPAARDEMVAAAKWARARLEADSGARIGIVVPDLAQSRAKVQRIFASVLAPSHALPGASSKQTLPFNISLGVALAEFPLVHDALLALELAGRDIAFNDASRLLRSPFLTGAEAEMTARARLDAALRRRAPPVLTLDMLLRLMQPGACPQLAHRLSQLAEFRKTGLFGAKPPSEWARAMSQALDKLGFPGERSLDSAEHQTAGKWVEVLAGFAALDRVAGKMNYAEALARLRRMAADTVFQPEAEDVPIQVLGVLESAGMEFDHLWVMGLTGDAWPLPARPNPFIPVALQRAAGVPEADAALSLELDRRITAGWLTCAGETVFSHPQREDDRELAASPLIAAVAETTFADLGVPEYPTLRETIHRARKEDRIEDAQAPALAASGPHSGGTKVFSDQAACPFRAFAAHRLGAEALETPEPGLNAKDRGTLLHTMLTEAWKSLHDSKTLAAIGDAALGELLGHCAAAAIARLRRWKPEALQGRFAELEAARLARLAKEWLEFEKQRPGFSIAALEQKRAVQFGGTAVNARLDRMDKLDAGGHAILDYKTGDANVSSWLGPRPDEPQLPLYALGGKEDIAAVAFARVKAGAIEFKGIAREGGLLPGVKTIAEQRSALAKGYGSWDKLLEGWQRELDALGRGFASGDARVDPKHGNDTCRFCGMQPLCRINERSGAGPGDEE